MQLSNLAQPWRWHYSGLLRPALIMGSTLLLLLAASYRLPSQQTVLLIGAVVALWAFLFAWRWPQWGIIGFALVTLSIGVSEGMGLSGYVNEPMVLVSALILLWVLDMVVRDRKISLVPSAPMLPLLALLLAVLLAFANGQLLWFFFANPAPMPAQLAGLALYMLSAGAFLIAANRVRELCWLRYITWLFLFFGALFVTSRLVPSLGVSRLVAPGLHGSLFWVWVVSLSLAQALINDRLKLGWRVALGSLALATLAVGFFQHRDWASAWMPALGAALVVVWLRSWRQGLLLVVLGVCAKLVIDPGLLSDLIAADDYSINTRWIAWQIVVGEIARVSPILGLGPANYYHYTPLFPILGWYVQFNSHNQYVDLIAQVGFFGLIAFFWFAAAVALLAWRLRTQAPDGFARAYIYGALAGLAGTLAAGMLADWVLPFVYNIGLRGFRSSVLVWFFLGGVVAIEQMIKSGRGATE
jgi:hypothetical protein